VTTFEILKEKGIEPCLLIIPISISADNRFTKFDMVTNWKLDCFVKGLFPI